MVQDKAEQIIFDSETKSKIGAVTYIVSAHFDEAKENLHEKILKLLSSEVENKIAQLKNSGQ